MAITTLNGKEKEGRESLLPYLCLDLSILVLANPGLGV